MMVDIKIKARDNTAKLNQAIEEVMRRIIATAFCVSPEQLESRHLSSISQSFSGLSDSVAWSLSPMGRSIDVVRHEEEIMRRRRYEEGLYSLITVDWASPANGPVIRNERPRTDHLQWYNYRNDCRELVLGLIDRYSGRSWEVAVPERESNEALFTYIGRELVIDGVLSEDQAYNFVRQAYERMTYYGLDSICNSRPEEIRYEPNLRAMPWEVVGDQYNCATCRASRGEKDNEADKRAKELLLSCLTKAQREEFEQNDCFTVVSLSGKKYRIEANKTYNIKELHKSGRVKTSLCAGPKGISLPIYDFMLAQKCLLEANEEEFLKVANKDLCSFLQNG